jgi:hypothetical protein
MSSIEYFVVENQISVSVEIVDKDIPWLKVS